MFRNLKQLLIASFLFFALPFGPCWAMEKDNNDRSYDQTVFENFHHYKTMIRDVFAINRNSENKWLSADLEKALEKILTLGDFFTALSIAATGINNRTMDFKKCNERVITLCLSLGAQLEGLEFGSHSDIYQLGKKLMDQCKNRKISEEEILNTISQLHKRFIIPNFTFQLLPDDNGMETISADAYWRFFSAPIVYRTPLLQAIKCDNVTAVKALVIKGGVDVNMKNLSGQTPLELARSLKRNDEIIEYLTSCKNDNSD